MATVSLADKYYGTYESQQKKADIPEFVTFMKQYGTVAYPVLSLSDSKKALVKEAIPLIKTDKWKSGDVAVSVKKYVISSGAYLTNRNKDITSNCCKIISPKGDVYACDMNMSKTLYYDRDGFFFNKRAEKNFVKSVNRNRKDIESYLLGSQRYVYLRFECRCYSCINASYMGRWEECLLFDDGYLFNHIGVCDEVNYHTFQFGDFENNLLHTIAIVNQ